jgi:hypothetical protein
MSNFNVMLKKSSQNCVMIILATCNLKPYTMNNTSWIQKLWNYKWNFAKKEPLKVTIMLVPRSWILIHNEFSTKHQYISTYDDNIAFLVHVTNTCLLNKPVKNMAIRLSLQYEWHLVWHAPKSRGETHLRISQSQVAESWDLEARSRLPTLKRGRGSSWKPRD